VTTGQDIVTALDHTALSFVTEDDLQQALEAALAASGFTATREVRLSDGRSRIDLLVGRVGIEVKTDGGRNDVVRQLTRYAHCPELDELVLVTTRTKHHHMPVEVAGKPLHLVSLIGAAL
jgi:hypothetical protein